MQKTKVGGEDYYTIAVDVGSPAKTVHLEVNTNSPISWVDYTKTPILVNSTTAVNEGAEMSYAGGAGAGAAGIAFKDKFCLKAGSSPICIAKQPYILCDQVTGYPKKKGFDGMLGLGQPSQFDQALLNMQVPGKSFLQEANASKVASNLAFGMAFTPSDSFITFGEAADVAKEAPQGAGAAVTMPLSRFGDESLYWMVPMSMSIGKGEGPMAVKDLKVKLDSSSEVITAPAASEQYLSSIIQMLQYQDTNEAIGHMILTLQREVNTYKTMYGALVQQLSKGQCNTDSSEGLLCYCNVTLQPLTFIMDGEGGKKAKITLESKDLLTQIAKTKAGDPVCQVNIQEGDTGFWTMGSAFLRHAYTVYNVHDQKVSFYPLTTSWASSLSELPQPSAAFGGPSMMIVSLSALMGVFLGVVVEGVFRVLRLRAPAAGRTPLLTA
jgi:hypothetical protein